MEEVCCPLDKGAIDTSERFSLSRFFVDTEKEKEVDLIPKASSHQFSRIL